jgi:glutamate transport system substrate-binding protein
VTNSTPASNIEQYLGDKAKQLVLFDIYQKCVDALKGGQVDAVTTDNVILSGFISTNEGQFKLAGQPFTEEPYGIGLKKGDTAFKNFINDTLEKAFQEGTYAKVWKETAGKFDTSELKTPTIDRS